MTERTSAELRESRELVVPFSKMDGPIVRLLLPVLFGLFAAGPLWLLFLCANQLRILAGLGFSHFDELQLVANPSTVRQVIGCGVALIPATWFFGWLTARIAVIGWRSTQGSWWLRLSSKGFEVNDRVRAPRRYRWREIDKFMLVGATPDAVLVPVKNFADVLKEGGTEQAVLHVGFSYSAQRNTVRHRLWLAMSSQRGPDGTRADGIVMGFWDRPFDEAVDLMNDWLSRYR